MRKFERIGMVVLRSTTLCVAVSSFTRSWRLTVISIAAPCATDCSTVSTIDTDPPPPPKVSLPGILPKPCWPQLYNSIGLGGNVRSGFLSIVFVLQTNAPVEIRSLDSGFADMGCGCRERLLLSVGNQ